MADLKQYRASLVKGILGRGAVPAKVVLRGMADLEKALERRFRELHNQRAELSKANAAVRRQLSSDRKVWAESVRNLCALEKTFRAKKVTPPAVEKKTERVFLGSIGATRVPPFDYAWTWTAKVGAPLRDSALASVNLGKIEVDVKDDNLHKSSASARAALGIFFSSPSECPARFTFWANPAFEYLWWDVCQLASAHSDGFIGLYAGAYDWSGNHTGTPVDQMISLWSDDSWWWGAGQHSGSSRSYPLHATFEVDREHFYALWVWCGVTDSSDGWGDLEGSSAGSDLVLMVPSISWELG